MSIRKVPERPSMPQGVNEQPRSLVQWARNLVSSLASLFQQYGRAINELIDRSVRLGWIDVRDFGPDVGQGGDDTAAFQAAHDALGDRGTLFAPGGLTYRLNGFLITKPNITVRIEGKVLNTAPAGGEAIQIGPATTSADRVFFTRIIMDDLEGTGKANGQTGIRFKNTAIVTLEGHNFHEMANAIFFDPEPSNTTWAAENKINLSQIQNCDTAVRYAPVSSFAEGNEVRVAIFGCQNGYIIPAGTNAGGMYIEGVIDNAIVDGSPSSTSTDYINEMAPDQLGSFLSVKFVGDNRWRPGSVKYHPNDVVVSGLTGDVYMRSIQFLGASQPFFGTIPRIAMEFDPSNIAQPFAGLIHVKDTTYDLDGVAFQVDVAQVRWLATNAPGDVFRAHVRTFDTGGGQGLGLGAGSDEVRVENDLTVEGISTSTALFELDPPGTGPFQFGRVPADVDVTLFGAGTGDSFRDFLGKTLANVLIVGQDAVSVNIVAPVSSQLTLNNNIALRGKTTGGTIRNLIAMLNDNVIWAGQANHPFRISNNGTVGVENGQVINVAAGTQADHAVNKSQLDAATSGSGFPSGTRMVFHQATAPTGWTTDTNAPVDRVLVVDHTAAGNTTGSPTWAITGLSAGSTGSTSLTVNQMPSHTHRVADNASAIIGFTNSGLGGFALTGSSFADISSTGYTESRGGGAGHSHSGSTISQDGNWRPPRYFVQIAIKD